MRKWKDALEDRGPSDDDCSPTRFGFSVQAGNRAVVVCGPDIGRIVKVLEVVLYYGAKGAEDMYRAEGEEGEEYFGYDALAVLREGEGGE